MSKIIKITVLFSLFSLNLFSQNRRQTILQEKIIKVMNEQINFNEFKDSSAVYSFTLKIIIDYSNKKIKVSPSINNTDILAKIIDLNKLTSLDYSALFMTKKHTKILTAKYIIIVYGSRRPSLIDIDDSIDALKFIHNSDNCANVNLGIFKYKIDKKIYN